MTASARRPALRMLAAGLAALGLAGVCAGPGAAQEEPTLAGVPDVGTLVAEASAAVDAVIAQAGLTLPSGAAVSEGAPPEPAPPAASPLPAVAQPDPAPPAASPPPASPGAGAATAAAPPTPAMEPSETAAAPIVGPAAAAEQVLPANVSVSVRIGSAGDNGPVTQVNAATAVAPVLAAVPPPSLEPRYQQEQQQYQAPLASSAPTAAASAPAAPAATEAPTVELPKTPERWDWTWTLGCGDASVPILPAVGVPNWNWNWNYVDCGGEATGGENVDAITPTRYQAAATQYQPLNISVSIRIGSPGSDGAVTQANVVFAASLPSLTQSVLGPAPPAEGGPSAPVESPAPAEVGSPPEPPPAAPDEAGAGSAPVEALEQAPAPTSTAGASSAVPAVELEAAAAPAAAVAAMARPNGAKRAGLRPPLLPLEGGKARHEGFGGGDTSDIAAPIALRAAPAPSASGTSGSGAAATARPMRVERVGHVAGARGSRSAGVLGSASAGVAPAGAPERNLAFVALLGLFSLFFLDSARRVASGRAAPAAEPGRRPERPG